MLVFVPMKENEYQDFTVQGIKSYAAENVRAGIWQASEAETKAEKLYRQLLPEGLATKDHFFYHLMEPEAGRTVGHVWYGIRGHGDARSIFLYDIAIDEIHRRKGFGTQAMVALEARAKEVNAVRIALHVFGHNRAARALYENLGYEVTNLQMVKDLFPSRVEKDELAVHAPARSGASLSE